jgi:hypothetical protein
VTGLVTGLAGADVPGDGFTTLGLGGDVRLTFGFDTFGLDDRVGAGTVGVGSGTVAGPDRGGTSAAGSAAPPKTTDGQPSCHPATAPPPRTTATLTAIPKARRRSGDRRNSSSAASMSGSGSSRKPGRVAPIRRGWSGSGSQPGGTACRSASRPVDSAAASSIGQPQARQYRETILFNCSQTGH